MTSIIQYAVYLIGLIVLAYPLGKYIKKILCHEPIFLSKYGVRVESRIYAMLGIDDQEEMTWKSYLSAVLVFFTASVFLIFMMLVFQDKLPFNSQNISGLTWDLALNTAISFATNTNWQSYSGEMSLSYFSQFMGLAVQNFVSAATGIAVLFALIRSFMRYEDRTIGNFWVDLTRIILYVLIPINLLISIGLVSGGVVQSFKPAETGQLLEPYAVDMKGERIENADIDLKHHRVSINGKELPQAHIISKQFIPLGPAASQISIKQTGTNGGGFFGVNSAHPFENPSIMTNFIEVTSILLIPAALCFTFGEAILRRKQGYAIFAAMFVCLVTAIIAIGYAEHMGTPQLNPQHQVNISANHQAGGNMEGKESRFGIVGSAVWTAYTTAASNGSVNAMHDSYTPMGGMVPMILMQLGEVIFGGVGSGLYGMIAFIILTVFIAGLMVGRTPEFLGKKIEPYEMKWAVLLCLATPIAILIGSGLAALYPGFSLFIQEKGVHGFSELLYAYTSAGANNGSAFAGLQVDNPFVNVTLGVSMVFARILPIIGSLAIAGSLVQKKKIAITSGTLATDNGMFVSLLIIVICIIGALSFLPALALGPIAEHLNQVVIGG